MITESELRRIAGQAGLGVGQAEHEYVLVCALDALAETSLLSDTFCLKGGTALRQLYFPDWRHSLDLDFTVLPVFPAARLETSLTNWLDQTKQKHGIEMSLQSLHKADGAARARARFLGPLRHPNRLLLDITLDEPVILPPHSRPVITGLFADPCPQVLCYQLEEILAEKLRSILQRGKARDYYDVWRLFTDKARTFDRGTAREVLRAKCGHKRLLEPSARSFLEPALLEPASAYWSQELMGQVPGGELPSWEAVVADLRKSLADFFR
jgi:predicted nucleotidyltransferase component of viral defense system